MRWDAMDMHTFFFCPHRQTERMRLADGGSAGGSGGGAAAADSHGDSEGSGEGGDAHGGRGGGGAAGGLDSDADEPDSEIITLFATGDADVIVREGRRGL